MKALELFPHHVWINIFAQMWTIIFFAQLLKSHFNTFLQIFFLCGKIKKRKMKKIILWKTQLLHLVFVCVIMVEIFLFVLIN